MSPAFMLILVAASAQPATPPPKGAGAAATSADAANGACHSQDAKDIVVCAQRSQPYRLDPAVDQASRQVEINSRSATAAMPPAQAICSSQPRGCGKDLRSLDLANVAIVVGTAGLRAAEGKDWTKAFRTGGPDEYQLYRQARQRREAQDAERAAARLKAKAREAERQAAAASDGSR